MIESLLVIKQNLFAAGFQLLQPFVQGCFYLHLRHRQLSSNPKRCRSTSWDAIDNESVMTWILLLWWGFLWWIWRICVVSISDKIAYHSWISFERCLEWLHRSGVPPLEAMMVLYLKCFRASTKGGKGDGKAEHVRNDKIWNTCRECGQ